MNACAHGQCLLCVILARLACSGHCMWVALPLLGLTFTSSIYIGSRLSHSTCYFITSAGAHQTSQGALTFVPAAVVKTQTAINCAEQCAWVMQPDNVCVPARFRGCDTARLWRGLWQQRWPAAGSGRSIITPVSAACMFAGMQPNR